MFDVSATHSRRSMPNRVLKAYQLVPGCIINIAPDDCTPIWVKVQNVLRSLIDSDLIHVYLYPLRWGLVMPANAKVTVSYYPIVDDVQYSDDNVKPLTKPQS
jgi:hypothetical protein